MSDEMNFHFFSVIYAVRRVSLDYATPIELPFIGIVVQIGLYGDEVVRSAAVFTRYYRLGRDIADSGRGRSVSAVGVFEVEAQSCERRVNPQGHRRQQIDQRLARGKTDGLDFIGVGVFFGGRFRMPLDRDGTAMGS